MRKNKELNIKESGKSPNGRVKLQFSDDAHSYILINKECTRCEINGQKHKIEQREGKACKKLLNKELRNAKKKKRKKESANFEQ